MSGFEAVARTIERHREMLARDSRSITTAQIYVTAIEEPFWPNLYCRH